jgi:hypothetical protein
VALETRANDRRYFYRSRREGDRVIRQYIGSGPKAMEAAEADRQRREERATADAASRKELDKVYEVDGLIAESSRLIDAALSAALLKAGCHHHRGEWRKREHGSQT